MKIWRRCAQLVISLAGGNGGREKSRRAYIKRGLLALANKRSRRPRSAEEAPVNQPATGRASGARDVAASREPLREDAISVRFGAPLERAGTPTRLSMRNIISGRARFPAIGPRLPDAPTAIERVYSSLPGNCSGTALTHSKSIARRTCSRDAVIEPLFCRGGRVDFSA